MKLFIGWFIIIALAGTIFLGLRVLSQAYDVQVAVESRYEQMLNDLDDLG